MGKFFVENFVGFWIVLAIFLKIPRDDEILQKNLNFQNLAKKPLLPSSFVAAKNLEKARNFGIFGNYPFVCLCRLCKNQRHTQRYKAKTPN